MSAKLISRKELMDEYGLGRRGAEALMLQVPNVRLEGMRKRYVWRRDAERYLAERTEKKPARKRRAAA